MKKVLSVVLSLLMLLSCTMGLEISVQAVTNGHSQADAVEWIKTRGNENWWKDVDNKWGCQCVDLTMAYYAYLGQSVSGHANEYLNSNKLPSGWWMDTNPSPGSIIVWDAYTWTGQWKTGEHGHVGLVYDVSGSNIYTVETNTGNTNGQGSAASAKFKTRVNCNAKFIHPDFLGTTPTEKPSVSANNTKFAVGSNVTFSFNAPNADSVYLGLYLNGEMYFNGEFSPSATYTRTLTQTGHYAFYIVAHYPSGNVESDWADFDVYESLSSFVPDKPQVWTNGNRFSAGTDITVYHWSETAKYYSVSVYRDNTLLKNEYIYTGTSVINYTTPGDYKVVVGAINDYGESQYGVTSFTIYKSVPDAPILWVDNDTFEVNVDFIIYHWSNLAKRYVISIYKNDNQIICAENYSSTYTTKLTESGEYTIIASAFNEYGESELSQITIRVVCKSGDHNWNNGTITTSATCTATGVKTYTCTACGATKTETIAKKAHSTVTDTAVPATCTTDGKTAGRHCSVCGEIITEQTTILATGHNLDNGTITKKPTYTETGTKEYKCTVCGEVLKTETIAKLAKKANTLKASGKTKSVKYSTLKKKNLAFARKDIISINKAQGKVNYKKTSGNKKITVSSSGKLTVKKGLKKGTYKVKVKVTAAGNSTYKSGSKTVTVTIKVK